MRLALLALVVALGAGCEVREVAHQRAAVADVHAGMTEQQVIDLAGPPSRTLSVNDYDLCKGVGGEHLLLYDAVSVFLGKEYVDASVAFCIGRNGNFIDRSFIVN